MILRSMTGICVLTLSLLSSSLNCELPNNLIHLEKKSSMKAFLNQGDMKRNSKQLRTLCTFLLSFDEGDYTWEMVLVYNPQKVKGSFWFLPHDDENTAFDSAVYSTKKYGGGFLAILSNNNRSFKGQDPNRNFGKSMQIEKTCIQQNFPAPLYSKNVFDVIDTYRKNKIPYLALHNNKNGWYGNGGSGGVSIFNSSSMVKSYPSGNILSGRSRGIKDEDSLVYIAGTNTNPPKVKLEQLTKAGIHVKYEVVSKNRNDCSMSNYIILNKGDNYYNVETEHGDALAQRKIIDALMGILNIKPIKSHQKSFISNLF